MAKSSSKVGPIVAGAVGAAVGATAAVILSDKKKRDQISSFIEDAKDRYDDAKSEGQDMVKDMRKKADTMKTDYLDKGEKAKKLVQSAVKK